MDTQFLVYGLPAITIVIAFVKVLREVGLPTRFAPSVSLAAGLVLGLLIAFDSGQSIPYGIIAGVLIGASACGVYDVGKFEPKEKEQG